MNQLRILFGGTFDPIHQGHLMMSRWAQEYWPDSIIHFIPCHRPGHREQPIASGSHRLAMIERAIEHEANMIADPIELNQAQISYTLYTVQKMQQYYPDSHFAWLMGYDSWIHFNRWYHYQTLAQLCHFIIVKRADYTQQIVSNHGLTRATQPQQLNQTSAGYYYILPATVPNISASALRQQLADGEQPAEDELPPVVYEYINRQHLYR